MYPKQFFWEMCHAYKINHYLYLTLILKFYFFSSKRLQYPSPHKEAACKYQQSTEENHWEQLHVITIKPLKQQKALIYWLTRNIGCGRCTSDPMCFRANEGFRFYIYTNVNKKYSGTGMDIKIRKLERKRMSFRGHKPYNKGQGLKINVPTRGNKVDWLKEWNER